MRLKKSMVSNVSSAIQSQEENDDDDDEEVKRGDQL